MHAAGPESEIVPSYSRVVCVRSLETMVDVADSARVSVVAEAAIVLVAGRG